MLLLIIASLQAAAAFYLSEFPPQNYCKEGTTAPGCKSVIDLYVNRLTSIKSAISYDYSSFDFCQDEDAGDQKEVSENIGQVLFGERIQKSPYQFNFGMDEQCHQVCARRYDPGDKDLDRLKHGMLLGYEHHWIVDNLPVAWCYMTALNYQYCRTGFQMGCYVDAEGNRDPFCVINKWYDSPDTFYLFNHVDITLTYHSPKDQDWKEARLVKVTMIPRSYKYGCSYGDGTPLGIPNKLNQTIEIQYTYSVRFVQNNSIEWESRWDYILAGLPSSDIIMQSVIATSIFSLYMSIFIVIIFLKFVYNVCCQTWYADEKGEEYGWKFVCGDVFRPPGYPMLLSVCCGAGTQIFMTTFVVLIIGCCGLLSPSNRGALETTIICLFLVFGIVSGYTSARLYKTFDGERQKVNVIMTAFVVPGTAFIMFFLLNFIHWGVGSSTAIPVATLCSLFGLWLWISVPLTFVGAYLGYKKKATQHPVRTKEYPRPIPPHPWYKSSLFCIIIGGILPFGCMFIQLFFVFTYIWSHQMFYMFGIVTLITFFVAVTCGGTAAILCQYHLNCEDYRWWWRSFLTSGSTAVYFLIYSMYFYFAKLDVEGVISAILYFGYILIVTMMIFLFCGTAGFFSCYSFVTHIYSTLKYLEEDFDVTEDIERPIRLVNTSTGHRSLEILPADVTKTSRN